MDKNKTIKDRIIQATTELIGEYEGDIKSITARRIAQKAGVGLGLINYHFGSKENLITACVQRIIGDVVAGFRMEQAFQTDKERLTAWATHVFHFLFTHPAICRISILGDFQDYTKNCNSVCTQYGLMRALREDIADADKPILIFMLTAAMQTAFLGSETAGQLLGYDFAKPKDRAAYIQRLADILFERTVQAGE